VCVCVLVMRRAVEGESDDQSDWWWDSLSLLLGVWG
jgi:hypothetical protein